VKKKINDKIWLILAQPEYLQALISAGEKGDYRLSVWI
jgi:hypothetical protein